MARSWRSRRKQQILLGILSLIIVVSMVLSLVVTLIPEPLPPTPAPTVVMLTVSPELEATSTPAP
ncbi:MAG: hypothetical protein JW850_23110 [Thermoflexales bacterium]|nr:hypothetical protein [Thermoflexales bacterium]